ncbi:MAG: rhomboid family intramembrane serine protease [Paracoccus sp. (in: a-proteobacteria)]
MFPIRDHNPSQRTPYVTYALIAANIVMYLMTLPGVPGGEWLWARLALYPLAVVNGQLLWGLLTHMFLHAGLLHVGGNMLFLWVFGDNLEDQMGHRGFLAFYLAAGLAAAAGQIAAAPFSPVPMVGASGAIAGVMGHDVGQIVREDRGELILVAHQRQQTGIDPHLAAGKCKRPRLFDLEDCNFEATDRASRTLESSLEIRSHTARIRRDFRVLRSRRLARNLIEGRSPELSNLCSCGTRRRVFLRRSDRAGDHRGGQQNEHDGPNVPGDPELHLGTTHRGVDRKIGRVGVAKSIAKLSTVLVRPTAVPGENREDFAHRVGSVPSGRRPGGGRGETCEGERALRSRCRRVHSRSSV